MTSINTAQAFYNQVLSIHEEHLCNVVILAGKINLFLNKIKDPTTSFEDLPKEYAFLNRSYEDHKSLNTRITIASYLNSIQKAKANLVSASISTLSAKISALIEGNQQVLEESQQVYQKKQELYLELLSLEPQLILDLKDLDKRYEHIETVMDTLLDRVKDVLLERALFGVTQDSTDAKGTLSPHSPNPIQDSGCVSPLQNTFTLALEQTGS